MMQRIEITLRLTLRSPFIMQGLEATALGVDAAALRDEAQRPLVPADQVKGLLRAACVTLERETQGNVIGESTIRHLFGEPSDKRVGTAPDQDRPNRGALVFGDLVMTTAHREGAITRVHIDPVTGAAKTGHVQTVELVAPIGKKVVFEGAVIAHIDPDRLTNPSPDPGKWLTNILNKAIGLVPAVGALKSAGFGQVVTGSATIKESRNLTLPDLRTETAERVAFRVTFDRRLLVDAQWLAANVRKGSAVVPGAVFKGALAERLKRAGQNPEEDGELMNALSAIRFSHAFPDDGYGGLGELALPLSLFVDDAPGLSPVADGLVGGAPDKAPRRGGGVPTFQADWKPKHWAAVRRALGFDEPHAPACLPRGHVEIGEDYVAVEGQLFVDVARSHMDSGGNDRVWHLKVSRNGIEAGMFGRMLDLLESEGLDGIGATGARATFTRDGARFRPGHVTETSPGFGLWAVMLATPAMMLDPLQLLEKDSTAEALFEAYRSFWADVANAGVLVNFYASQRLTGGYLAVRRRLYGRGRYYPFLLTEPGSVFLLKGELKDRLTDLVTNGLPVMKDMKDVNGSIDWRNCPYMPENGYGEIIVNRIDHAPLAQGVTHG